MDVPEPDDIVPDLGDLEIDPAELAESIQRAVQQMTGAPRNRAERRALERKRRRRS